MSMFTLRRSQKQSGFTLMELLIVIAVLGLLLGMMIPRLAGVTDDTVDTVCDTNNKGTRYMTQLYINKHSTWPDKLTNLIDMDNTAADTYKFNYDEYGQTAVGAVPAYLPTFQDDNVADAEVMALEFFTRNVPGSYMLSEDEVEELNEMGITTVFNFKGEDRAMEKHKLESGDYVMMMGMSSTAVDGAPAFNFAANYKVGNPEWIGRIMLAVNDKCDLVTSGMLQASALCPGAVLNQDNFSHKEYILVLPRLEATVDKADATLQGATLCFADSKDSVAGKVIEVVFEAQPSWNFDMSCPEGHKWPDNDEDHFVFNVGTSGEPGFTHNAAGKAYAPTFGDIYTTETTAGIY